MPDQAESSDARTGHSETTDAPDAAERAAGQSAYAQQHGPDEPLYVISVAAKLVGMPAWTLRVLDEQGIVSPVRTDKNRRLYSDRDLIRLSRVRTLTDVEGVNMNGVKLILKLEEEQQARKGEP